MLNIEKYEKELRRYGVYFALTKEGKLERCGEVNCLDCAFSDGCPIKRMNWLLEEYKEPILSDEAKAYLKAFIEPVECTKISKYLSSSYAYELRIYGKDGYILIACSKGTKLYEYFKNMQDYKNYTPEELGLC